MMMVSYSNTRFESAADESSDDALRAKKCAADPRSCRAPNTRSGAAKPNLTTVWNSDFGCINFSNGWYDNPEKTISGTLSRCAQGTFVFEGLWGRSGDEGKFEVIFEFSQDGRTFTGKYRTRAGQWKTWNGSNPDGNPTFESCAVAPVLSRPWASTFGDIDWSDGYYSNDRNKTISGRLRNITQDGGTRYVWSGQWGRQNSSSRGEVESTFSADGRSFTGWYSDSNGNRKPWSGNRQ